MVIHTGPDEEVWRSLLGNDWRSFLDLRSLQSIALYLKMPMDLEKVRTAQLAADVGAYFHHNFQNAPVAISWVQHLARTAKVDTSVFDFLCTDYSVKLIVSKLNRFNVFGTYINEHEFMAGYNRRTVLNYHSDISAKTVQEIMGQLHLLMAELKSMAKFKKCVGWFGRGNEQEGKEKLIAAVDFFVKNPLPQTLIVKMEDLETYFFDPQISEDRKELVFGKIGSLYRTRRNRKNSKKIQCNFTVDVKTVSFISSMAKEKKISRSELLELIFKAEHSHALAQISKV